MGRGVDSAYNPQIDNLKGILILFVIVGHLFTDGVDENPWKWAIYSFHMPLFFGLGGFLTNVDGVKSAPFMKFIEKYSDRMLFAWLLAFILYIFTMHIKTPFTPELILQYILNPPYHTWYVPVYFLYICIIYFVPKPLIEAAAYAMIALGIATMVLVATFANDAAPPNSNWPDPRYITMAPFFFFGLLMKRKSIDIGNIAIFSAIFGGAIYQACYFINISPLQILPFLILNFGLIGAVPRLISIDANLPIIRQIGWDSLYFYLWHPFIIMIFKKTLYKMTGEFLAAAITFVIVMMMLFACRLVLKRHAILRLMSGVRDVQSHARVSG